MPITQTSSIALDIGHSNLKILQTAPDGRIVKSAVQKMPDGCMDDLSVVYDEALINSLKEIKKAANISGGKCTLVISGSEIITRHFTLPILPEEELYQNILNEMSSYLPVGSDKYYIDYKIVDTVNEEGVEMYRVLVSTVHKRIINKFRRILSAVGLKLVIVDTCENAKEKLLKFNKERLRNFSLDDGLCMLDMGSKATRASIYYNGEYFVGNILKRSGQSITDIYAKSSGRDILVAETIKREVNLLTEHHDNAELKSAVTYEVDALLLELMRVFDYFRNRTKAPITKIYISGGGSLLPGLAEYMQGYFGISVLSAKSLLPDSQNIQADLSYLLNAYAATLREDRK